MKKVRINRATRQCYPNELFIGLDGENLQEVIEFSFEDTFVDGIARLELVMENNVRYIINEVNKVGKTYQLPVKTGLTKYNLSNVQLVITESGTDIPIFKTEKMKFIVDSSINAGDDDTPPEEYDSWIDIANEKIAEIDEAIDKTNRLDLDVSKENNVTTVILTKKTGFQKEVNILDGTRGPEGPRGLKGDTGLTGNGILDIEKTSTLDLVDTYTINYTNGNSTTFDVTNGRNGTDGINGTNGVDGYSPYASVEKTEDTAVITIEDFEGTTSASITDGYSPLASVTKSGNIVTISITDKNGTTTQTLTDPDMTNYYTKTEIDGMIGNINTILATLTSPSNGGN